MEENSPFKSNFGKVFLFVQKVYNILGAIDSAGKSLTLIFAQKASKLNFKDIEEELNVIILFNISDVLC